ncbi:PepSY domain-containing protein [Microbulbifer sp. OS29]|uniref:PepSY domain-containing protein n=1 Tax=Microbulbifer okhotskensis TaxID=2926617 RepID=A0A9X2J570_9GAMM|nr:PepSY domain-containing protein [Microbulbifer okhotskensis]MCO1334049.1 PepSY domain-containing protein [Microbulbifer okhotskensis]
MKPSRAFLGLFAFVTVFLPALCTASLNGYATYERESFHPQFLRVQGGEISRDRAASLVKKRFGGKILSISETNRQGRTVYRVKGLSAKSQVYVVFVDKQSGRISR